MGEPWLTPNQIKAVSDVAKAHGLRLYMDGARVFNAAVALKIDVQEFTRHVDNLMFCLSKGLSCPVGRWLLALKSSLRKHERYGRFWAAECAKRA